MSKKYGFNPFFTILVTVTCFFLTCVASQGSEKPFSGSKMVQDETSVTVVLPAVSPPAVKDFVPASIRKEAKSESLVYVDVDFSILRQKIDLVEIWLGHEIGFVTAVKKYFKKTDDGTFIWRGTIGGNDLDEVCFVFSKRFGVFGGTINVRYRNRFFQVNSIKKTELNILWEVNFDSFPPFKDISLAGKQNKRRHKSLDDGSLSASPSNSSQDKVMPTDVTIVDVLVLFSKGVYTRDYSVSATIDHLIDSTNWAFAAGGANVNLNIVGKIPISAGDPPCTPDNIHAILDNLKNNQLYFENVNEIRNALAADLVVYLQVFNEPSSGGACYGAAYCPDQYPLESEIHAFSVITLSDSKHIREITFSHELGHNFSLDHHVDYPGTPDNLYSYGYGYCFGPYFFITPNVYDDDCYTIMAIYDADFDDTINRYSDPTSQVPVYDNGVLIDYFYIGDDETADSILAINSTAGSIAAYRTQEIGYAKVYAMPVPDDDGENSMIFTVVAPDARSGSTITLIVCDPIYTRPWYPIPNALKLGYEDSTNWIYARTIDDVTSRMEKAGTVPNELMGNELAVSSTSEVWGARKAFTAVVHYREEFVGEKKVFARYRDEYYHNLWYLMDERINVEFIDMLPEIGELQDVKAHEEGGQVFTDHLEFTTTIQDGNSAADIEKFYILITQDDIVNPLGLDPDIEDVITSDDGTLIRVRPGSRASASSNKVTMWCKFAGGNYGWVTEEKIYKGSCIDDGHSAELDNSRTTIEYEAYTVKFKVVVEFHLPFGGLKNIYVRAKDYGNNDTGWVKVPDPFIIIYE